MPTERFKRLSVEKKTVIRKAAMKEFARVSFEKASINQIIQNAGISRGSFYTYFEGKQDLLDFLVEEISGELNGYCEKVLVENEGDYFAMMDGMLDHMIGMLNSEREWIAVAKNVFAYEENLRGLGLESRLVKNFEKGQEKNLHVLIVEKMNHDQFREMDEEELQAMVALGGMALLMALKRYYEYPEELEEAKQVYRKALDVIRYGALPEQSA